jgi:hypothetical protein
VSIEVVGGSQVRRDIEDAPDKQTIYRTNGIRQEPRSGLNLQAASAVANFERGCSMRNLMGFHAHVGEFPEVLIESCDRDVFSRSGSRN